MNKKGLELKNIYVYVLFLTSLFSYTQTQIGQDINGYWHLGLGEVTSLSADGNTVAIGCWNSGSYSPNSTNPNTPNDIFGNNGSVRVYTKKTTASSGEQWEQVGDVILPKHQSTDLTFGEEFGTTLSLSNDGNVIAIGASGNDDGATNAGLVRVYEKLQDVSSPGGFKWVQIGNDIEGVQAESILGKDVSLSGDGTVVVVGAPNFDINGLTNAGQVKVYKRSITNDWVQIGGGIEGQQANEYFGMSVSISNNGNTLAIAGTNLTSNNIAKGIVTRVYKNVNDNWVQIGDFKGKGTGDFLKNDVRGANIHLTGDGNNLAIAEFGGVGQLGYASVYTRDSDDNWTLKGDELQGERGVLGIALSEDANTLVVGTPFVRVNNTFNAGSVHVYKYDLYSTNNWQEMASFQGEHLAHRLGDVNSLSLSADGSVLSIGASDYGFTRGFNYSDGRVEMFDIGVSSVSIEDIPIEVHGTDAFQVTFKFNKGVTNFSEEDIVITNASVTDFEMVDASTYTANIIPTSICSNDDDITISVAEGAVLNVNSNIPNLASKEVVVKTAPGPVAKAKNISVQLEANGEVTILPEDIDNGSFFSCSMGGENIELSITQDTFTCADVGTPVEVELTATSGALMATTTAIVTVENTANNLVAVAQDITVELDTNGEVTILPEDIDNGSFFNCSSTAGAIAFSLSQDTFTCADVGTPVEVELTATSGALTTTATAMVTVENTANSLVAVAQDITVELDTNGEVTILPEDIDNGSFFNCSSTSGAIAFSLNRDTFTCADVGIPVEVELTAASGALTATTTAMVTVENTVNSLVAVAQDITVELDTNGEVTILPEDIDNGSFFNCSSTSGAIVFSLNQDTFTCADVGTSVEVELTATSGVLTATTTAMVTVENTVNSLVAVAQDITVQLGTNGEVTISPEDIDNGSFFNCSSTVGAITFGLNQDTFTCADVGTPIEVELTATSGALTATTTAMVTIENTINSLVAVAQDITVQLGTNGEVTISPEDIDDGSFFNCGSSSGAIAFSLNQDTFTCANVGTPVEVELTATLGAVTDTATAMVTVEYAGNCKSIELVNVISGISPNSDGIADTLEIKGLERFKNNIVKIYDLNQRLLFSGHYTGPSSAWNGTHKGKKVPVGSYVCVIDYNESYISNNVKMIYVNY